MRRLPTLFRAIRGSQARALGPVPALVPALALALGGCTTRAPQAVVWAWERPEDLRALARPDAAIAFWAGTLRLGPRGGAQAGARLDFLPREQALQLPPGHARRPVVRILTAHGLATGALDTALARDAAAEILADTRRYGASAIQIDFDAARSERGFYRQLLAELRARLPRGAFLSMTALASWCLGDRWLAGLPVDEVVPMFFRMGADSGAIRAELALHARLPEPLCRDAIGLSVDEPLAARPSARTVYYFNPHSWAPDELKRI